MDVKQSLDSYFGISERGSTLRRETSAGVATFLALAYILAVNPSILAAAGMDPSAVMTATILGSALACFIMALYAKLPIALAPGMGINAFFAFTVVVVMGYSWEQALAAVFVASLIFLLLSLGSLRVKILNAIPVNMRKAITAAIGTFICFVGLQGAGIIVGSDATLVALGDLTNSLVLLALGGIVLTSILFLKKVPGAILLGIVITAIVGMILGIVDVPANIFAMPAAPDFGAFWTGLTTATWDIKFVAVIISFLFVIFFDTAGTITSVGERAGMVDENGDLVNADKAMLADAIGSTAGAVIGVSPVTCYIESNVGVESGGRTGFVALIVGLLFLATLFLGPVFSVFSFPCTAAALLIVGALMMSEVRSIEWLKPEVAIAAFITIIMMLMTYSITDGIGFGIIMYCIGAIVVGRGKEVSPLMYGVSVLFIAYFAMTALL